MDLTEVRSRERTSFSRSIFADHTEPGYLTYRGPQRVQLKIQTFDMKEKEALALTIRQIKQTELLYADRVVAYKGSLSKKYKCENLYFKSDKIVEFDGGFLFNLTVKTNANQTLGSCGDQSNINTVIQWLYCRSSERLHLLKLSPISDGHLLNPIQFFDCP